MCAYPLTEQARRELQAAKRIMIVGQPGAGKSTLARMLGKVLDLPVVHIDLIHWHPGWIERDRDEKDRLIAQVHARDKWIFEGGRSVTWPERLDRADALVWLDFSLGVRSYRILKRRIKYIGRTRPDLPDNCPERLDSEFLSYVWNSRVTSKQTITKLFNEAPIGKLKVQLQSKKDVDRFLEQLREPQSNAN